MLSKYGKTSLAFLCALVFSAAGSPAQQIEVKTDTDVEQVLKEKAGIVIDLPEMGYHWQGADFVGSEAEGSFSFAHTKIIYFFIHWGSIEVEEITPEFVRERIPKLWPSEGLKVTDVKATTVAGHPAIYADAVPQRQFYSPHFLIWNCRETNRQFIADMNYNIQYRTPEAELKAQIETVSKTLACHPGAPTSDIPGHVAGYDNERFGISFKHPLRWYVNENPYSVANPAYKGYRDKSVGSILAWLKDRRVNFTFIWEQQKEKSGEDTETMGGSLEAIRAAMAKLQETDWVKGYSPVAYETIEIGNYKILKFLSTVDKKTPEKPNLNFIPTARAQVMVIDSKESNRRLYVLISIDYHSVDGVSYPPDRDIFDRWAIEIGCELKF